MKTNQVKAAVGGLMLWTTVAMGQTSETNFEFSVNQAIPDGNVLGLTLGTNLTVAPAGWGISDVTVDLNITGGYNGDLYAYLAGPGGGFAVLLNRVGVSNGASAFGYNNGGFNVVFSDAAAASVQYYQNYTNPLGGQLLGTWQPEGITIDPLTNNPAAFLGAPRSAMLGSFTNTNPNGVWTLFLADVAGGNQSTVVSWSLDIITVPEPASLVLAGLGLVGAFVTSGLARRRRSKRRGV